jgi:hypothetical protein
MAMGVGAGVGIDPTDATTASAETGSHIGGVPVGGPSNFATSVTNMPLVVISPNTLPDTSTHSIVPWKD